MRSKLSVCAAVFIGIWTVSSAWATPISIAAEDRLNGATAHQDEVLKWNEVWLDTIRDFGAGGGNVPPTTVSRQGAILQTSVFDAINSIEKQYQPYLVSLDAPAGTSPEAAVASAAYTAMVHLYPYARNRFGTYFAESMAAIPDGAAKTQGIVLGTAVANAIISDRINDGASNDAPYVFNGQPGQYQPTPPQYLGNPIGPNWGMVTPWALTSGSQFRPGPPPALDSSEYAAAFNEVKSIGSLDSNTRTAEQAQIGSFWANDRAGTFSRVGQMNHVVRVASLQAGLDMYENARLLALANIATADGIIAAWDAKYDMDLDFWRPVTGIRQADRDGNPNTLADPNWEPLSNDPEINGFTPFFPSYISGHATLIGATAQILREYFGTDELRLTVGTDDPGYTGGLRTYANLTDMAQENADSRVYLGIHWRFDVQDGVTTGELIGNYISQTCMQPIPEPEAIVLLLGAIPFLSRRLRR